MPGRKWHVPENLGASHVSPEVAKPTQAVVHAKALRQRPPEHLQASGRPVCEPVLEVC